MRFFMELDDDVKREHMMRQQQQYMATAVVVAVVFLRTNRSRRGITDITLPTDPSQSTLGSFRRCRSSDVGESINLIEYGTIFVFPLHVLRRFVVMFLIQVPLRTKYARWRSFDYQYR
jgi:hypothetical protein